MKMQIVETGNRFGSMNTGCFPKEYDQLRRKQEFLKNRIKAGNYYGFDPLKFYMPSQKKDGSYQVLTEEMVNSTVDGWDLDIPADILMVTDKTPRVVVGYPVADCAVVIMSDLKNGITATAHCSGAMVDNYLPKMTLEALKEECDSKEDNIMVYISACAGNSWIYKDNPPVWATKSEIWEETGALTQEGNIYRIDLRKAILAQLKDKEFKSFVVNPSDTITNDHFYSHSAYSNGNKEKFGRHFAGAFYQKVLK